MAMDIRFKGEHTTFAPTDVSGSAHWSPAARGMRQARDARRGRGGGEPPVSFHPRPAARDNRAHRRVLSTEEADAS